MEWKTYTIGEICGIGGGEVKTGPFGSQLHQSDYSDYGIPVVMPKDIIEGTISVSSIARVNDEHVTRLARHKLSQGDIVYGRRGDIGRQALIRKHNEGWLCGTGCLRISLGSNSPVSSTFLHLYLKQLDVIRWICNKAVGATMPNLNTEILKSIPITFPTNEQYQERVSSLITRYDSLIENNNRRITILEDMAQSLYREWFVNLRYPDHADNLDAVGKPKLTDSPLGQIPEGWEVKRIKDIGIVNTGKTPSKKRPEYYNSADIPFLKTPDMHGAIFSVDIEDYLSLEGANSQKNKFVPANSVCVSCIGARAGVVTITSEKLHTNQQINSVVLNDIKFREYFYLFAVSLHKKIHALGSSGATMTNVNKSKFEGIEVIVPPEGIIHAFNLATASSFDLILNLQKRNKNLKKQRDMLLPKLISGQIELKD